MARKNIKPHVSRLTAFKSDHKLIVRKDHSRGILTYGKDNKIPGYYLKLYKEQPTHGSIVNAKAMYLAGLSIKSKSGNPQAEAWLKKVNPTESAYDVSLKTTKDQPLYGGFAVKVIPNMLGVPLWYFHMDWGKCRITECGTGVKYSEDWDERRCIPEVYPIWYPGCTEISIYIFRTYNPSVKKIESEYPAPEYESAIMDIDTEVRVSNFFNSLVINGFSAATIVTIYGGRPDTQQEEDEIVNSIMGRHEGDEKAGRTAFIWADENSKGAEIKAVDATDLDKQFQEVSKRNAKNIYAAHAAPAELFSYISDQSTVFDVSKIVEQNELFMNTYVIPKQKAELAMLSLFYKLRFGVEEEFVKEQFKPVGINALNPEVSKFMTNDEVREKLGLPSTKTLDGNATKVIDSINSLSPLVANKVLESMSPDEIRSLVGLAIAPPIVAPGAVGVPNAPVAQVEVNDHLKNLTGKQTQGIMRIVRKFKAGDYSQAQATILLKSGFGLTDEQIKEFLEVAPVQVQQRINFAKQDIFFELFDKYAHDVQPDEVIETTFVGMEQFTQHAFATDNEIRNSVLTQVKGNPEATAEDIGVILGVSAEVVTGVLAWLVAKKLITGSPGNYTPTEKGLNKENDTVTEVYTEYTYDKRPDVPGPVILTTTRQWCRDFYAKFGNGKKALTFEAINSMSNDFGFNAWDYKGGWYTDPVTDETTKWCRHGYKAETKIRKTKK